MNYVERDMLRVIRDSIDNMLRGELDCGKAKGLSVTGKPIEYKYLAAVTSNLDEVVVYLPNDFRNKNILIIYNDDLAMEGLK